VDDSAARLQARKRKNPETIVPYGYASTMRPPEGESMDRRFFHGRPDWREPAGSARARLTGIGRGPTFHDCLVQVEVAAA
jgi:hypothetical protein